MDFLVIGLGNPGDKYVKTRHNAGFIAIDSLASKYAAKFDKLKFSSLCTDIRIGEKKVLLMKPQTYMNLSGEAVIQAMDFYKIPKENIVILVDDISLEVGKMRIRRKGSHGGQNGLRNISLHLKTDEYTRVKIGVGAKPNPQYDLADWVLSNFTKDELITIQEVGSHVASAVDDIIHGQTDLAMSKYNS